MRRQAPTLMLTRVQFYEDCTVGRLSDKEGRLLCMTLEPRWRLPGQHQVKRQTCIPSGIYPLVYGYDAMMRYQCWTLTQLKSKPRLCFFTKDGSVAAQTKGDILLGYLSPEGDGECPFEGRLYRPVEAFERLLAYYTALRTNHADFRLKVESTQAPVTLLPAVAAPALGSDWVMFKDYILQTL